ncbi:MAG: DUF447 domain-containing protein [Haloferacaceae archaeon]
MTGDGAERLDGEWPVAFDGVVESVVTTRGPNERWNVAALGLHAPGGGTGGDDPDAGPVTATTWGRTRTRRNFERRGRGVVQFVTDPRDFVDAALAVREEDDPVLDGAAAWVRVAAERRGSETTGGTERVRWALAPGEGAVRERRVPTIDRGFNAVIEATVAASRLDVPAYETATLLDRLDHLADVVASCGGPAVREAFERVDEYAGWRERR